VTRLQLYYFKLKSCFNAAILITMITFEENLCNCPYIMILTSLNVRVEMVLVV